jgi:hypothetical protein
MASLEKSLESLKQEKKDLLKKVFFNFFLIFIFFKFINKLIIKFIYNKD